jgi:hypothetical protein
MEPINLVIAFAGLVIAYLTYIKVFQNEPKEDMQYLLNQAQFARKSTKDLKAKLGLYAFENDCFAAELMQGLSFRKSIRILDKALTDIFSQENEEILKKVRLPKKEFENMDRRITAMINHIQEINTYFEFYIKKGDPFS